LNASDFVCPEPAELTAQLDEDFSEWLASLRPSELAELRLYQGVGYLRVNGELRGTIPAEGEALRRVLLSIEDIDSAIEKGRLMRDVCVYRGIRRALEVFGVASLDELVGQTARDPGYMSTTVDADVAVRMVLDGDDPAVIELRVGAGEHAAWLGLAGQRSRRGEAELLLRRRTGLLVDEIAALGDLPMIRATVVT
jgi:ADP-ribosyltransferase exoenzyme